MSGPRAEGLPPLPFLLVLASISLLVILILTLAGCGSDPPKSGEVTAKVYEESYVYYTNVCISYGKYGCTVSIPMPSTEPEHWIFEVRDDVKSERIAKVEVNSEIWHRYDVGMHWPDPR